MWLFGNPSAVIIAIMIVCAQLPCSPNAENLITSLRLCYTANTRIMTLSARLANPLANRWASRFYTVIIGKAGKKALNHQNKWGFTGKITAGVSTVKKNAFLRSKNGSFSAERRSPRVSDFDVLKVRLSQKPLCGLAQRKNLSFFIWFISLDNLIG